MLTLDWWKQGHKTGLKTIFEDSVSYYVFFLLKWVYLAPLLLACFNHKSSIQEHHRLLLESLGKSLANESKKEEFLPYILIGQPKREPALRLCFSTFLLVN